MKKILTTLLALAFVLTASAQEAEKSEIVKTGLNFGPLPAVGYSSDLGWHYGALSDIYWYGDGSTYPDYMWKANVEISKYSKGNTVLHSFFDSKYLIPGIRVSAAVSYFGNKTTKLYEPQSEDEMKALAQEFQSYAHELYEMANTHFKAKKS